MGFIVTRNEHFSQGLLISLLYVALHIIIYLKLFLVDSRKSDSF